MGQGPRSDPVFGPDRPLSSGVAGIHRSGRFHQHDQALMFRVRFVFNGAPDHELLAFLKGELPIAKLQHHRTFNYIEDFVRFGMAVPYKFTFGPCSTAEGF